MADSLPATPLELMEQRKQSLPQGTLGRRSKSSPQPSSPPPVPQPNPGSIVEEISLIPKPPPPPIIPPREEAKPSDPALNLPSLFGDAPPGEPPPVVPPAAPHEEEDADIPETLNEKASEESKIHFTRLRGSHRKLREKHSEEVRLRAEAEEKLARYEKGELFPEEIAKRDQRISELEPLEKIVNLKTSREYKAEVTEPLTQNHEKLKEIAAAYSMPPELLQRAAGITSKKDENAFLSQYFDQAGADEVRGIFNSIRGIHVRASELEKEPEVSLQTLRARQEEREAAEATQRFAVFTSVGNGAFTKALHTINTEGKIHELTLKPNDDEFNRIFVRPVQTKAAQEFGRLVTGLAQNGLKHLPDGLATSLADMVLKYYAQSVTQQARDYLATRVATLERNAREKNKVFRPRIGGAGNGIPASTGQAPKVGLDPMEAAAKSRELASSRR